MSSSNFGRKDGIFAGGLKGALYILTTFSLHTVHALNLRYTMMLVRIDVVSKLKSKRWRRERSNFDFDHPMGA
jgi:hypothetical protein